MSNLKFDRAAALDRRDDLFDVIEGVHLHHLAQGTSLLVCTVNSLYRIVVTDGPEVYIQGGLFFPAATPAHLDGASVGGSCRRAGWIGIGLLMEIRSAGQCVITSPVRTITMEHVSSPLVH